MYEYETLPLYDALPLIDVGELDLEAECILEEKITPERAADFLLHG